jgi:hypothetical protein
MSKMQLSAELFSNIVSTMQSDERHSVRHEKRKEGRVGVRCSIEIIPQILSDAGERKVAVTVRDISPSGMGFIAHEKMPVGQKLLCRLPCENLTTIDVMMTVRHCLKLSSSLFGVGVSFVVLTGKPAPDPAALAAN